jgi:hypothetical protein
MQNNAVQHLLRAKPLWQQTTAHQPNVATAKPQAVAQTTQPSFNFHLLLACVWATLLQSPVAFGIIAFAAVIEAGFQMNTQPFAVVARNWAYALLNGVLLAAYFLK